MTTERQRRLDKAAQALRESRSELAEIPKEDKRTLDYATLVILGLIEDFVLTGPIE